MRNSKLSKEKIPSKKFFKKILKRILKKNSNQLDITKVIRYSIYITTKHRQKERRVDNYVFNRRLFTFRKFKDSTKKIG